MEALDKDYEWTLADLREALTSLADERLSYETHRLRFEEHRARLVVGGQAEGKNETERAARLTLAIRDTPDAEQDRQYMLLSQHRIAELEAQCEIARLRLSGMRQFMRLQAAMSEDQDD